VLCGAAVAAPVLFHPAVSLTDHPSPIPAQLTFIICLPAACSALPHRPALPCPAASLQERS
jgi:hypothetical protein